MPRAFLVKKPVVATAKRNWSELPDEQRAEIYVPSTGGEGLGEAPGFWGIHREMGLEGIQRFGGVQRDSGIWGHSGVRWTQKSRGVSQVFEGVPRGLGVPPGLEGPRCAGGAKDFGGHRNFGGAGVSGTPMLEGSQILG